MILDHEQARRRVGAAAKIPCRVLQGLAGCFIVLMTRENGMAGFYVGAALGIPAFIGLGHLAAWIERREIRRVERMTGRPDVKTVRLVPPVKTEKLH